MDKIKSDADLEFKVRLVLTEVEARALMAITKYGTDAFLKVFYTQLGDSDLKPHSKGIASLFTTIRHELPSHLGKMDTTRKLWKEQ